MITGFWSRTISAARIPFALAAAIALVAAALALTNATSRSAGASGAGSNGASLCFGELIATQTNADTATVINQSSSLITQTIGVGAQPYAVTYSGDGRFAFIGEAAGNAITMIDTSTNAIVRTLPINGAPYNQLSSNRDGSLVWTQTYNGSIDELLRVDTTSGTVTRQTSSRLIRDMFLSPDEQSLWTLEYAYPNTYVARYSSTTLATISSTLVAASTDQGAMTSDGTKIYMPNVNGNTFLIFDTQTLTTTTLSVAPPMRSAALDPSGTRLYSVAYTGGSFHLAILELSTLTWSFGADLASIAPYTYILGMAISADGSKIYIANMNYASGGLYIIDPSLPSTGTFLPTETYNEPAVCPLATDPAPATTTTTASDPIVPTFTA